MYFPNITGVPGVQYPSNQQQPAYQMNPSMPNMQMSQNMGMNPNMGMNTHMSINPQTPGSFPYLPQQQLPQANDLFSFQPITIQPYTDREFLCKTFNFKVPYIEAFLSLTHE